MVESSWRENLSVISPQGETVMNFLYLKTKRQRINGVKIATKYRDYLGRCIIIEAYASTTLEDSRRELSTAQPTNSYILLIPRLKL